ncbi:MAG TPA: HNH endonuclease family protein [Rubellimicrobium sp.]|nr:HNH endonuclease family protein [Rubellimicrobium sp.]
MPEPLAQVVRAAEGYVDALLQKVGLELPGGSSAPAARADTADVTEALALLERIPVRVEQPRGYDREAWAHWLGEDGDCQDARQEVLAAESLEPVRWDVEGCDVTVGLWRDAYTGETYRDPQALEVDHVVPLAEAHRSGGRDWTPGQRAAFANDLGDPRSLVAVSASANRSKGDQGPEEWLPSDPAARCGYVAIWVAVKVHWSLAMDERERINVGNLLRACAEN